MYHQKSGCQLGQQVTIRVAAQSRRQKFQAKVVRRRLPPARISLKAFDANDCRNMSEAKTQVANSTVNSRQIPSNYSESSKPNEKLAVGFVEDQNQCEKSQPQVTYMATMQLECRSGAQLHLNATRQAKSLLSPPHRRKFSNVGCTHILMRTFFAVLLIKTILNNLQEVTQTTQISQPFGLIYSQLPQFLFAEAAECTVDDDCGTKEKICHEKKCICIKDTPVEHKEQSTCLAHASMNEPCYISEQCLGKSECLDGTCLCGSDHVSIFNPSSRLSYCHPKRKLNEECGHDSQCPDNAFCSKKKCLCQNGYAPMTVANNNTETQQCAVQDCARCETTYHRCEDNKCKCLAAHFDPHTAKCYEYAVATGGKPIDNISNNGTGGNITNHDEDNSFYSILEDLTKNSDRLWLVVLILIVLTIALFALIFLLGRKYYLGYCWTAHKKEYEPNNESAPKNGYFNKNSINNKSFRQKNGETDEDDDDTAADRSNLMTTTGKKDGSYTNSDACMRSNDDGGRHRYVKVDIGKDKQQQLQNDYHNGNYQPFHHQVDSPLASSTSTPV